VPASQAKLRLMIDSFSRITIAEQFSEHDGQPLKSAQQQILKANIENVTVHQAKSWIHFQNSRSDQFQILDLTSIQSDPDPKNFKSCYFYCVVAEINAGEISGVN
jgi:hypothetical protein